MGESLLVSTATLSEWLDSPDVRVVDVRERWAYDAIGHVPGAVNVPFDRFRVEGSPDPGTLPGAETFASLLGEAGIDPDDRIVAYDDTHGVFAARFVLTAIVYGHADVFLLDGDFSAWRQSHRVREEEPTIEPTDYVADPLEPTESPIVGTDDVRARLEDGDVTIVDTREAWEYEEGHLPGAVRLDWMELVDPDTRGVKAEPAIESILRERGVETDRTRPIVLYCNTARRLSHTYVVLRSIGFQNVCVYEESLTAWDGPIESTC
ncbi:MAG: sulfurtransferase [Halobacteriota archaeon]